MTKENSLSSDINIVKELEELRLKQKLLISSLNKKNKNELEISIIDLTKKVDFLVKIFQDSNSPKDETEEIVEEKNLQIEELKEKLEKLELSINENFENLNKKISEISTSLNKKDEIKNFSNIPLPPLDIEVNSDIKKIEEVNNNESIKKEKKKWF